ncbi:uncharacterized protein BP01DRAFT_361544 [Aspergillus saccharolyticus JOP 1030-1]|uniref:Uncharacterized protein n=1 Tax=Aspergillus saccharolyticus JOP 1030-1 TaxID=1450539 RepID=A0A318Z953_9EURO|nr:hypothetical protein BP01DRAFT_361544 [Aspergillus saccharolyticus JOP 1030-1]PYH40100.1 hypothetical protein BP01DRAFT_361544 [Aspergillus saccharolyticus JOP 1030-1]
MPLPFRDQFKHDKSFSGSNSSQQQRYTPLHEAMVTAATPKSSSSPISPPGNDIQKLRRVDNIKSKP